jgi:glutaredoxin
MAKTYFDEKGIEYQDIDVTQDTAARDEMVQKSGQMGVPVITIDSELVIGFDKKRIEDLLKAGE